MPRYLVKQAGFYGGILYDPRPGHRNYLLTDRPVKPLPAWLAPAKAETTAETSARVAKEEEAKTSLKAAKADIKTASFMGGATEVL